MVPRAEIDLPPYRLLENVKTSRTDAHALLSRVAGALGETLESDGNAHAAIVQLHRLGLCLTIRVEVSRGTTAPEIVVQHAIVDVPQFTGEDGEILRSLGISNEPHGGKRPRTAKSGRRQPR
jgi:hypothetical protein